MTHQTAMSKKNEERKADPVGRSGTGRVESVRFTLALLDDSELLERSRMAEGHPGTGGGRR
jgi:hypothetical protein